jgi:hypothetical protein
VKRREGKNMTSSNSSKKDSREEVVKERKEAKRRILKEDPHMPKDKLELY